MKSEEQFLELIDTYFPRDHEFLKLGRGDDCAILAANEYCVSSDLFIEDVHFRRDYFSAADIGYKALAVNISDIAAMGAKPVAFSLDLMAPADLDNGFWDEFFKSMSMLARQSGLALAGGDLSRADKLGVSITIFGVAGGSGTFISRGNASPDDLLFIVGDIGLARSGLMALEATGVAAREVLPAAVMAHLRPKPKVMIGTLLNAAGVTSLMDLSDGLARDLPRLLGPERGADLTIEETTLHGNVLSFAQTIGTAPLEVAMLGGEDYALLGAVSPDALDKVGSVPGLKIIGTVTESAGITLNGAPFTATGFDHFGK
ncbi:thiamine-phosphate kinase [Pseudodesulfovibrio sediminis]|uniref:Thiamine-monophosphate kinase n=1 Tax=Pseudodesulfovibrio sediminis TaxID=2810563 RepID=A0ABM7P2K5_9BACT|nr:thiamine-phosphate kinase [Pseudodesulfovibrio sediminis]BCS87021.1 thiamine-monophosphate kinase [Pseudodesulfovibrio sediminis]